MAFQLGASAGRGRRRGPGLAQPVPVAGRTQAERVPLAATDCSWSAGDGLLVEGPIGAILLLLTGRQAGLARLSGPGARELSAGSSASPR